MKTTVVTFRQASQLESRTTAATTAAYRYNCHFTRWTPVSWLPLNFLLLDTMARYSLFVLKVPLNPKQTNNLDTVVSSHPRTSSLSCFINLHTMFDMSKPSSLPDSRMGPCPLLLFSTTICCLAISFYTRPWKKNFDAFCCILNSICDPTYRKVEHDISHQHCQETEKNNFSDCEAPTKLWVPVRRTVWTLLNRPWSV